jgi:hypothetical protein
MLSFCIDYKSTKTELCEIGKKYDTDKSSQRSDVTNMRHCHPYTIFYDTLFKHKRYEPIAIAELGILDGSSLLMWQEYFPQASIYGFEYDYSLLNKFITTYNNDRIHLSHIDVTNQDSLHYTFRNVNTMYDIIIEDTTHQFEDQIRAIQHAYLYLKPGGILIVEDIFKSYDEHAYITRLAPILHHFQDYYFISLDHVNRNSTGWNNDKLFVLVKAGAEPIFKNNNKLTIITPSCRLENLQKLRYMMNFNYIEEWIIVYDGKKVKDHPHLFASENNCKIKEYLYEGEGISGNPQRNYALTQISNPDTFLYYLDDDNVVHPQLYYVLPLLDKNKMYTFNQKNGRRLNGNTIQVGQIDTAMFLIDFALCKNKTWISEKYDADGYYIMECFNSNSDKHIFIDNELCFYNIITEIDNLTCCPPPLPC